MNKCLNCDKEVKNKYCNTSCQNKHLNPLRKLNIISIVKICPNCNKEFNIEIKEGGSNKKEKSFCSISCANTRIISIDVKEKISKKLLIFNADKHKPENVLSDKFKKYNECIHCNKEYYVRKSKQETSKYCSKSCATTYRNLNGMGRNGGIKSILSQNRRSKNEIYFSELCIEYFKDVKCNEPMFNGWDADVIIEDIKHAVLWNGAWHYKKITEKHSVKQVQNRDKIKIKEITKAGYTPYIIKDMGKYNPAFVKEQFDYFIIFSSM